MTKSLNMSTEFSFIILTYDEEQHLPRLLSSIAGLNAETFILDSGSRDKTLDIAREYQVPTAYRAFNDHPEQWNAALHIFPVMTPWVICLDADQLVTPELFEKLAGFKNEAHLQINGIYFNRKNIFKGKWLKNGGYYPKFLLKMFRYNLGYSDLNENMDHKFQVPGKTLVWKTGHLIEENLKENSISFWIEKHNRYSDLLATEEVERIQLQRQQTLKPQFWGSPNERNAWLKRLWWQLPRYIRPLLYFSYRIIFQRGFLDGKTGVIFHFLQGFWFRLIVDIKIEEKLTLIKKSQSSTGPIHEKKEYSYLRFAVVFPMLFFIFYFFNLAIIGITNPGGYYNSFLDQHLNYINLWRDFNISFAAKLLRMLGYEVFTGQYRLHVQGKSGFILVYSCLGYGILSLFSAFVMAYPKPLRQKIIFLCCGILVFQLLNTTRLILIALYGETGLMLDAHRIFNGILYAIIAYSIYLWLNHKDLKLTYNGENTIKKSFS